MWFVFERVDEGQGYCVLDGVAGRTVIASWSFIGMWKWSLCFADGGDGPCSASGCVFPVPSSSDQYAKRSA